MTKFKAICRKANSMANKFEKLMGLINPEEIAKREFEVETKYREYTPTRLHPENLAQLVEELNEFEKCFWRYDGFDPEAHPEFFGPSDDRIGRGEQVIFQHLGNTFPYKAIWERVAGNRDGGLLGLLEIIRDHHKDLNVRGYIRQTLNQCLDISQPKERSELAGEYLNAVGHFLGLKFNSADVLYVSSRLEEVLFEHVKARTGYIAMLRRLGIQA